MQRRLSSMMVSFIIAMISLIILAVILLELFHFRLPIEYGFARFFRSIKLICIIMYLCGKFVVISGRDIICPILWLLALLRFIGVKHPGLFDESGERAISQQSDVIWGSIFSALGLASLSSIIALGV